jgi:hypothetical protein
MSSPVEQFSNLSLRSPMPSPLPIDEFNKRKTTVQDILSSFSVDLLPSELRPDVFRSIDRDQLNRPSEWTITGDLEGTLMQWGVHNGHGYEFLKGLQPESARSRLFHEKLSRRVEAEFEAYRNIDRTAPAPEIRDDVREIANNLQSLLNESLSRQLRENRAVRAGEFVDVLRNVCENSLDISGGGGRRTRRSSGSQGEASLFHMLIIYSDPGQDVFILPLLDWMATDSPEILRPQQDRLIEIGRRLVELKAPNAYREAFQAILSKLSQPETSDQRSGPPAPSSAGLGTKRPAGGALGGGTGKRGKGA